jgi:hypothetical protein
VLSCLGSFCLVLLRLVRCVVLFCGWKRGRGKKRREIPQKCDEICPQSAGKKNDFGGLILWTLHLVLLDSWTWSWPYSLSRFGLSFVPSSSRSKQRKEKRKKPTSIFFKDQS